MYECDSWTIKKAECRRTDAFELWCRRRLLRVPWRLLPCKKIQPVHPRGNQSWIFTGRTDVEAVLWPPEAKSWLIGKDPDAGKDWGQEQKGMTEDETVGWHHRLNGHGFEQVPGDGEGQESLVCCGPWGPKCQTLLRDWTTIPTKHVTPIFFHFPEHIKVMFTLYSINCAAYRR